MFKALSQQNAARFQRPPAACVRAPVLSVLHKLKLSQMSCGINGSFNPPHALIRTITQPRCVLINSKWFCNNFSVLLQKNVLPLVDLCHNVWNKSKSPGYEPVVKAISNITICFWFIIVIILFTIYSNQVWCNKAVWRLHKLLFLNFSFGDLRNC